MRVSFMSAILLSLVGLSFHHIPDECQSNSRSDANHWTGFCSMKNSYDFIIIGGGTAGCVLANRLSEVAEWSVLLLEAGGDETYQSQIPFLPQLTQHNSMDWKYTTTRQANICQSEKGGYCNVPRGKVLGGCSSTNYMVYMRGLKQDFDRWSDDGSPEWSWQNVNHYFEKSVDFGTHIEQPTRPNTGEGYLPVEETRSNWLSDFFSEALQELGLERHNLNEDASSGFMPLQVNVRNGARVSSNQAFIKTVKHRSNLDVLTFSFVRRIILKNGAAIGVEYEHDNEIQQIFASKEVILSAGAINSPQILMLSGIGPYQHLRDLGIAVVQDLPVGQNLHDHVGIVAMFRMTSVKPSSSDDIWESVKQYLSNRTGLLSMPFGGLMIALRNSSLSTLDLPDMQLHLGRSENREDFYINGFVCRPTSRGRLTLRSSSPSDPPLIDPNFLSTSHDVEVLNQLVDFIFRIAVSTSMDPLRLTYLSNLQPNCEEGDNFFSCLIKQYGIAFFHPVSTCKMGPSGDPLAVVNSKLKVYGVRGLRIVDASVMPFIPTSNINAPIILVAEKAADMIKDEHLRTVVE